MLQGTASSVGKSLLATAFCRIFKQDGYRVAPFKSQNMGLNSYVTDSGLEIGRAQAMQAEAAGLEPTVEMNPILLKPFSDQASQVVVMGKPVASMRGRDYYKKKEELWPLVDEAFLKLSQEHDIVVIEGAGGAAEINLRDKDLVNMGLALRLQAPVVLIGDIDRGGVFASLFGTCALLEPAERDLVKGVIINKFRGELSLLKSGLKRLEELLEKPVLGVVPHTSLNLDDEDSLAERLVRPASGQGLKIQVIRLPRTLNHTDFNPLELFAGVALSYIEKPGQLQAPDLLILPGSKNVMADLDTLRAHGWAEALKNYVASGGLLAGFGGGFQMLGEKIMDPELLEGGAKERAGFGFLPLKTTITAARTARQVEALWQYDDEDYFAGLKGPEVLNAYENHATVSSYTGAIHPLFNKSTGFSEGAVDERGHVFGTNLHGLFDNLAWTTKFLNNLARRRGLSLVQELPAGSYRAHKEKEYDKLADVVRASVDMEQIYKIALQKQAK